MESILIRSGNESWHLPKTKGYTNEAHLRDLLAAHPTLIPGAGDFAQVCTEFGTAAGSSDVVAVDIENGLTVVECKMASNPQVRREIIGQVLDYASTFWRMPVEEFDAIWCKRTSHSLFEDSNKSQEMRARLNRDLSSGEFRIILAVDEINDDLKRIVEYLNNITLAAVAVIAVAYSRSEDNGTEILVSNSFGAELVRAKNERFNNLRHQWSPDEYLAWVDKEDPEASKVARVLISALTENGFYVGGGQSQESPSLNCGIKVWNDGQRWPISLFTYSRGAVMEFRISDMKTKPKLADHYLVAIESAVGKLIDGESIRADNYARRPSVLLRDLSPDRVQELAKAASTALIAPW